MKRNGLLESVERTWRVTWRGQQNCRLFPPVDRGRTWSTWFNMAQKRKGETANNIRNARQKKKQKLADARAIAVQSLPPVASSSAGPSTSKTGDGMCYRLARLSCTRALFRYGQASEHHRRREVHRSPKFMLLLSLRLTSTSGKGVRNQCHGRGNAKREVRMVSLNICEFNE